jgi:hypothetical protein
MVGRVRIKWVVIVVLTRSVSSKNMTKSSWWDLLFIFSNDVKKKGKLTNIDTFNLQSSL